MKISKIGLIRHGETDWNKDQRSQGHSDIPLNVIGKQQAHRVGKRLAIEPWDLIYSSDLQRAYQTAEIIQQYIDLPHHTDPRLRERHGGQIEGTTEKERIRKWGESWETLDLGIESDEQINERGLGFLTEITKVHYPKNILIVSHGSFLKRILRTLLPEDPVNVSLENCSLTVLTTTQTKWQLELHNDIKHMGDN